MTASGLLAGVAALVGAMLLVARGRGQRHLAQMGAMNADLTALNRAISTLAAELEPDRLAQAILDAAMGLTGAIYGAQLERVAPDRNGGIEGWRVTGHAGDAAAAFVQTVLGHPSGLLDQIFRDEGKPRRQDLSVAALPASSGPAGETPISVRSYMGLPLMSRSGERLGALLFGHSIAGRFGEREQRLVAGFAGQAAVALDNARLFASVRREQSRFRAAVHAVHGVLWTNDAQGRMVGEQPGWAALTGQRLAEYQNYGWADAVHPEDAQATVESWNQAVAAGVGAFVFEHRVRRHDGAWRIFAIRALQVPEADGEWVGVHSDITEQREAEAELRLTNAGLEARIAVRTADLTASEARYRVLAENTSDVITCLSLNIQCIYASPACRVVFGLEPSQMVGADAESLLHPADVAAFHHAIRPLIEGIAERAAVTYRARHTRGAWVWIEAKIALVRDPGTGEPASLVCSLRDISERHQQANDLRAANTELERLTGHLAKARDRSEQASRAKSRFLAGMSHELRTPLNGVLGYARLLRIDGDLNTVQAARVDAMLGAGQHLLEMINSVLDLSEIEAGHVVLQTAEIDIGAVAHACLDLVRPAAEAKGLRLRLSGADQAYHVVADRTRLRQILLNLLGNAVKFTTSGDVEMRLRPRPVAEARLCIEVVDTGPGISAERRHELFQDFERLGADTERAIEGAGLGLALSSRLARLMGGGLQHADNPAGGSVFSLELPRAMAAAEFERIADGGAAPDPRPVEGLKILVVDDLAMNRDIASAFLRAAGHSVMCAEGGAAGVAAARMADFQVVLMDMRMPEVDGLEAARRIRALPGARGRVPIVALTAHAFAEQVATCAQAGMDGHLSKPYTPAALHDAVSRAAALAPDRRDAPARGECE